MGKIYIDIYTMKASGRIVSIMMAGVVVLCAFLLLSMVGKPRDGFQEGAVPTTTTKSLGGATATPAVVAKAPVAKPPTA